jgi:hypothetical protein
MVEAFGPRSLTGFAAELIRQVKGIRSVQVQSLFAVLGTHGQMMPATAQVTDGRRCASHEDGQQW